MAINRLTGSVRQAGRAAVHGPRRLTYPTVAVLLGGALAAFAAGRVSRRPEEPTLVPRRLMTAAGQAVCCGAGKFIEQDAKAVLLWVLRGSDTFFCTPRQVAFLRHLSEVCGQGSKPGIIVRTLAVGADAKVVQRFAERFRVPGSVMVVPDDVFSASMRLAESALVLVDSNSTVLWVSGASIRIRDPLDLVILTEVLGACASAGLPGDQPQGKWALSAKERE